MPSTTYSVFEANAEGEFVEAGITRSSKASAEKQATELRNTAKVAVEVRTGTGTVVFSLKAPGSRVISSRVGQYTRVETDLPEGFTAPKGTTPAYQRKRAGLVVCRKDDKTGYIVVEVASGTQHEVDGTKAACQLTSALGKAAREAKAALASA